MIPTPDLSHLTSQDFGKIYEPAEDTFLLLDALEQDQDQIQALQPKICLEIGSGSGCVTTLLAKVIGSQALYLTTDLNQHACKATFQTGQKNQVDIECTRTNLVNGLLPRLFHSVDILCFNPPYVVTPSSEVGSFGIEASWAGGIDGREVIDQFLPLVSVRDLLSPHGVFYLLLINENRPLDVMDILKGYGLTSYISLERRAGRERQYILKIQRES
ncbi:S-adenosyl-L-methionine-dependent methyltransferase [Halteromyces radiatus]|uniref:S-adenosyl-L-methionine-dependent methyltransferase n=1 Tax=Halteromyces radiatus TaxID=101107 RepID=UPI002221257E|nr:S-adenosyl-L-methionine-dependent methyltransferase [Halteromyces radiatus]KAI8099990.1 S-adenosyl-L-methionine-dependent methyltransferase [Halteromyces radiatus]